MKQQVIYPGTFDPITLGHMDLIRRALKLFDHVVVAIAEQDSKQPLFNLEERLKMTREVLSEFSNVEVVGFQGLLVEFAKARNINVILRGIRVISDFDYEFQLAGMNRLLSPEIETVFLRPADRYTYVSSSIVRSVAASAGDVSHFVPAEVVKALLDKYQTN